MICKCVSFFVVVCTAQWPHNEIVKSKSSSFLQKQKVHVYQPDNYLNIKFALYGQNSYLIVWNQILIETYNNSG